MPKTTKRKQTKTERAWWRTEGTLLYGVEELIIDCEDENGEPFPGMEGAYDFLQELYETLESCPLDEAFFDRLEQLRQRSIEREDAEAVN